MTWHVQISGEKLALEALSISFADDNLRIVSEEGNYFLEAKKLEAALTPVDVLDIATDILKWLSGVARLEHGARTPLKPVHVFRLLPAGDKAAFGIFKFESVDSRPRFGKMTLVGSDCSEVAVERSNPTRSLAELVDKDKAVSKALRLFGEDAKDWVGLYRLFEVILQDVGGIKQIVANGWVTKDSIDRFKHTANSPNASGDLARHGKECTQPPKNPMSLSDARSHIEMLLRCWMHAKKG